MHLGRLRQLTSPSLFQKLNWFTGGPPEVMNRRAPSRCSWKISSSIHSPAWSGWASSSPLPLTQGPISPGGTHSRMPPWPQSATSPPLGWAFPPTSVSPWRARSLLQAFCMGPLSGTLPHLSWAQCPFSGIGSLGWSPAASPPPT